MEINKTADVKRLQINKKINQFHNKKKNKKEEKGLSFSEVLNLVSKGINL